jgi:hypothetical protein
MIAWELLSALIVALILSSSFAFFIRRRGPRKGFFWFFLLIFLATWAVGIWIRPFGPSLKGIYWMPFLIIGMLIVLFVAVITPLPPPKGRHETLDMLDQIETDREVEQFAYISLNVSFWILLFVLIILIVVRYLT